jgi:Cfr10I/Bse634I restriction endonuclease
MPFTFSIEVTRSLPKEELCIEDRRDNPVRNRSTKFRLAQANMLAYTFPSFVPGFAESGVNALPFRAVVERPTTNARMEGTHFYGDDFFVTGSQIAKVEGDVFETLTGAILWNAAARWNRYMSGGGWSGLPRYTHPKVMPAIERQVAVLSLPRRYDWVRLLVPEADATVRGLRTKLEGHGLSLPTSTPDIMVVALPSEYRDDDRFQTELPNLGRDSQRLLSSAHRLVEKRVEPVEFVLGIAMKKSLRSDRLYQPLYEANIMQLLLEHNLGAPQVDFEVHTLESAGTRAKETYRAASLAAVASDHPNPHRAVRELYEPANAQDVVRRFLTFLDHRMELVAGD